MKKIVSFCLAVLMAITIAIPLGATASAISLASVWDGTASTSISGTGTSSDPFLINSAADLAYYRNQHNAGSTINGASANGYVKLMVNIVLNDGVFANDGTFTKTGASAASAPYEWTPISETNSGFVFDGNGHYISGMSVNASNTGGYTGGNAGFISSTKNSTVKNLTITNSFLKSPASYSGSFYYMGVFSGNAYNTTFSGCVSDSNKVVSVLAPNSSIQYAGHFFSGVCSYADNSTFNRCTNSGTVTGGGNNGGIVGKAPSTKIYSCVNTGAITNVSGQTIATRCTGGIAGMIENSSSSIINCVNLGTVSNGTRVGGLAGESQSTTYKNCYSLANVSGDSEYGTRNCIGILMGYSSSSQTFDCYSAQSSLYDLGAINGSGYNVATRFSGTGVLAGSTSADGLLNALNNNLYDLGGIDVSVWVKNSDGYPVPTGAAFVDDSTYYGLWVNNIRVSSRNCADVLDRTANDGLVSYDVATNTLTLKDGASLSNGYTSSISEPVIYSTGNLNIVVEGNVTLSRDPMLNASSSMRLILCSGSLSITSADGYSSELQVNAGSLAGCIHSSSLTLDGDLFLKLKTEYAECLGTNSLTILDDRVVISAYDSNEDDCGAMTPVSASITLPSGTALLKYEGSSISALTQVSSFTEAISGYTQKQIVIATAANCAALTQNPALAAAVPSNWTVPMGTANDKASLEAYAKETIKASSSDFTDSNFSVSVSNVIPAVPTTSAGAGTNGSFTLTVTAGTGKLAQSVTYNGTITSAQGYIVTYNANGGTGTAKTEYAVSGSAFALPSESGFTPPTGKILTGWAIGSPTGTVVTPGGAYTFTGDTTVYAVWGTTPTYTISLSPSAFTFDSASEGYSSVTGKTVTITNTGNSAITGFTAEAYWGFTFNVSYTSGSIAAGRSATFTITPKSGVEAGTYSDTVTVTTNEGTTAQIVVTFTVNHGDLQHFSAKAATYMAAGNTEYWYCSACGKYFSDADAENEISQSDTVIPKLELRFTDVPSTGYYYTPVLWALDKKVTAGTSDTAFSPNDSCTRAQAVTFIWNYMGKPKPETTECLFTDISAGDWYYKAVLWAYENHVTAGTSDTTFSPNDTVTRGQFVTFLWNSQNKPTHSIANPFADVNTTDYYYNSVLWAYENHVTSGTSGTTFSPGDNCVRAHVVTFLYNFDSNLPD